MSTDVIDEVVPGQAELDGMPEAPPDGATVDDTIDAPLGYTRDGRPRQRRPKGSGRRPRTKATAPPPPASRPGRPRASSAPKKTDYRPALNGLMQIAALPLSVVYPMDAAAIALYGPAVTEALNELAQQRPEVAAALERLLQVGPYGLVIAAGLPLLAQIMANHRMLPDPLVESLGAMTADRFQTAVMQQSADGGGARVPA